MRLQVAGQQGAYVARMINRGYTMGVGGLDQAPPVKVAVTAQGKVRRRTVTSGRTDCRLPNVPSSAAGIWGSLAPSAIFWGEGCADQTCPAHINGTA